MASILITGGAGQLGIELARLDWGTDINVLTPERAALDIADPQSIERCLSDECPSAIINAAAYTAVDRAEDEPEVSYQINAFGPLHLAVAAARASVPLVHISTDYVFGPGSGPRSETDRPGPVTVYGASKLAGEIATLSAHARTAVIRTAWVVSPHRSNFVKTMLRLAQDRDEISVVADQVGCPTTAADLAKAVRKLALAMMAEPKAPTGIFHYTNAGQANWAELAEAVMTAASKHGLPTAAIRKISTSDYPTRAQRPADSRLNIDRIRVDYGVDARPWRDAIADTVAEIAAATRMERTS